jgi:class I fructose-bisphosphate aldolase
MANQKIVDLLGDKASYFLDHQCTTIDKSTIHLPSASHVDDTWISSNRSNQTLRSMQQLLGHGRLADTGGIAASSRLTRE